jgi:uncharacterized membrane protein
MDFGPRVSALWAAWSALSRVERIAIIGLVGSAFLVLFWYIDHRSERRLGRHSRCSS